jgi:hypothetical protein
MLGGAVAGRGIAATGGDIAWDHAHVGGPRGRGGGLSRLRKRRQR